MPICACIISERTHVVQSTFIILQIALPEFKYTGTEKD